MPATAPVQKQQGLNQVVINKVQRMIEGRQGGVMDTINRLLSEGRIAQDFIAPIGVSQRSKERPVISFKAAHKILQNKLHGITCQPKILILFGKVLYVSLFLILCHTCTIIYRVA